MDLPCHREKKHIVSDTYFLVLQEHPGWLAWRTNELCISLISYWERNNDSSESLLSDCSRCLVGVILPTALRHRHYCERSCYRWEPGDRWDKSLGHARTAGG